MQKVLAQMPGVLVLSLFFSLVHLIAVAQTVRGPADLVIINGNVITNNAGFDLTEAVAVRGEEIIATGKTAEVLKLAGPLTRRIDLHGLTVIPGLIDTHAHALDWTTSVVRNEVDLRYPKATKFDDILKALSARAKSEQPVGWIVGNAWDDAKLAEHRYLTRRDLDAVTPSNPVYLMHVSGHLAVVNSAALKLANITAGTPDPPGGVIERDAQGEPTGIIKDRAMGLVARLLPAQTREDKIRAIEYLSRAAAEVGLTTIHDIGLSPEDIAGYREANRRGALKIRIHMAPLVSFPQDVDRIKEMGVHTGSGDTHLKFGPIKIFTDGGMAARTIALYPPSVLNEPKNFGLLIWKAEDLENTQQRLAAMGWQLATHAIGDRAIDQVLDSYAKIAKLYPDRDLRYRVIHCGIATPAIQKRLKELKALVDHNPPFPYWIGSWFEKFGPERVRWSYPGKSYFDNGITVSGGSDVPVTPISPWWGIWSSVVRREMKSALVIAPEERISVRQALQMYTANGAYAGYEEKIKGSIETGKLADFVVIDRNILEVPSDELKEVKVQATFVGGQAVYNRLSAGKN